MAYVAAKSLKHTIQHLQKSCHISLFPSSANIIESAYQQVDSIEAALKPESVINALDVQIRETVYEFEDTLESIVAEQILSQSNGETKSFSIDLQDLQDQFHLSVETLKKLEVEYIEELDKLVPGEDGNHDHYDKRVDVVAGEKTKLVGSSDQLQMLKDEVVNMKPVSVGLTSFEGEELQVVSLVGMAGIGKTTLAREVFEDPDILSHFDCRVWVSLHNKCQLKELPRLILAQLNPGSDNMRLKYGAIVRRLKASLEGRRFLIVLDDVWDRRIYCFDLIRFLPKDENGSRVLLTTRLHYIGKHADSEITMRFLDKKESWDLLRTKVFGGELCPAPLEKAGKKIAKNCDGLPLMIVTVAHLLSKAEKTPEYWSEVAAKKKHQLFIDAHDKISEVLYPSYEVLSQYLKIFFLRMGVFPENFVITRSELMNMWFLEEFLDPHSPDPPEVTAALYLEQLISDNLVMVLQKGRPYYMDRAKICSLHSAFWYLCKREAKKIKFFHVLDNLKDGLGEGTTGQRRLCFHNNILLAIKDVYNSMENGSATSARSLLCFGIYHQYPVPICSRLRLLRELNALTIRFYEFPMEVLNLVLLRYLSFTFNGGIPGSISILWDLRFLIVRRYLRIKSCRAPLYLPPEIWNMKELKHLQTEGSDLPAPNYGSSLQNLATLVDVSAHSCTKEVLERIPNLKKLGIQIEVHPDDGDDTKPLGFLNYISMHLGQLKSLTCVVVNPAFVSQPAPPSTFPSSLTKLHLSGFGYPWKYMSVIGMLPNLEALKLRSYAFRGPDWETTKNEFQQLRFLLIEDTDLVQWRVGCGSFESLSDLSIKYCYKLKEIHGKIGRLAEIEIVHCYSLDMTCLQKLKSPILD